MNDWTMSAPSAVQPVVVDIGYDIIGEGVDIHGQRWISQSIMAVVSQALISYTVTVT